LASYLDRWKQQNEKIIMNEQKENMENEKIQDIHPEPEEEKQSLQNDSENTEISFDNEENKEQKKSKFFSKTNKKSKQQDTDPLKEEIEKLKIDNAELQDKFLRLYSEFDNYRKRTQKEKLDIIQNAAESIIVNLLPVIDDMERAIKYSEDSNVDLSSMKEGEVLIFQKLNGLLKQKGLKAIEIEDALFNTDYHEAIATIPATKEEDKGKIVEVIEKGYMLNDKVIRFSKVVIYQ
jgi:molecular chaperone GrpE